ncbi:MAG: hypothetical protein U5L72_09085 [Bacteroidales bacterium]|nr:hypothetical protein [Bacteroidales bacterium]
MHGRHDSAATARVVETLHFKPRTDHAVRTGRLYSTDVSRPEFTGAFSFNTGEFENLRKLPTPASRPARPSSTAFRYTENNTSAAVMHRGEVRSFVMGFPFETIISQEERDTMMKQILNFLMTK